MECLTLQIMSMPTSYMSPINDDQAYHLQLLLEMKGYTFSEIPYTIFSAAKKEEKVNVTVYEKGPKVLVQGKGARDFIEFVLEPEVLNEVMLGYEEVFNPKRDEPHFGIDESGKGDFFGPLVIAGVFTDAMTAPQLRKAGVQDSKAIKSDKRIRDLAKVIRSTPGIVFDVIQINPAKYNEMYAGFKNLNRMLAWGHAKVIANLHGKRPDCPRALCDQFANASVLVSALTKEKIEIELEQQTKAESDIAVAAASILAREHFITWLARTGTDLGEEIPRGASEKVISAGKRLISRHGLQILENVAKMHFRTASQLTN